jgi:hypothetical protein
MRKQLLLLAFLLLFTAVLTTAQATEYCCPASCPVGQMAQRIFQRWLAASRANGSGWTGRRPLKLWAQPATPVARTVLKSPSTAKLVV